MTDAWQYRVETFKNFDQGRLENTLNRLGAEGWRLISTVTTVKGLNVTGNDMLFVFEKPGAGAFEPEKEYWG